ncbi:hypothetical protein ASPWEDRAFT_176263 [Aspergillus wentii DTO 134E9]|uniref:Acyl carrier protein n=1 Tax=Aspergillus wentii DTO 134E9 TaxID=1073089 RepID=A0A1L9R8D7_ASPWE|nr:uncharacterized protein ASPWEDRAFT_176263 [Aspergillus wentii DTO 134E9]OJJ31164.1 hypothetical protein ASPWEDRAFT_176263 [Aspergillus wentii DTO 134E9]
MSVEEKVFRIVSEQLEVKQEEVTSEKSFENDLGADSLVLVELILAVENEFDLQIADEEAQKLQTVGAVIDYVKAHINVE